MIELLFAVALGITGEPKVKPQGVPCGPPLAMRTFLAERYHEKPVAAAVDRYGHLLEIWVGPEGSFTVILTNREATQSCAVSRGRGYEPLD